jgi:hypothetical protein
MPDSICVFVLQIFILSKELDLFVIYKHLTAGNYVGSPSQNTPGLFRECPTSTESNTFCFILRGSCSSLSLSNRCYAGLLSYNNLSVSIRVDGSATLPLSAIAHRALCPRLPHREKTQREDHTDIRTWHRCG